MQVFISGRFGSAFLPAVASVLLVVLVQTPEFLQSPHVVVGDVVLNLLDVLLVLSLAVRVEGGDLLRSGSHGELLPRGLHTRESPVYFH